VQNMNLAYIYCTFLDLVESDGQTKIIPFEDFVQSVTINP